MRGKGIVLLVACLLGVVSFLFYNTLHLQAVVRSLQNEKQSLEAANAELSDRLQDGGSQPSPATGGGTGAGQSPQSPPQTTGKIAYLTFDDGPSSNTATILDTLQHYGVKATFFVIGSTTPRNLELYRRIASEGHAIGLHGYTHDYAVAYQSVEAYMDNLYRLQDLLAETVGQRPTITRFLGGSNTSMGSKYGGPDLTRNLIAELESSGLQYFDWNVTSADTSKPLLETQRIVDSVLNGAKQHKQAIILMHDAPAKTTTAEALPAIIEGLTAQGFSFAELTPSTTPVHFTIK